MYLNGDSSICRAGTVLLLAATLACGGGGGGTPSGQTTTTGSTGGSSAPTSATAPAAIFPVHHLYQGDPDRTDWVPFAQGLTQGNGKLFFINNALLQSFDPATGGFTFGNTVSGDWLVYEGRLWIIGRGGYNPYVESLVDGQSTTVSLGSDFGPIDSATSDGEGHLFLACEGHGDTDPYPAKGATLVRLDVASQAVTPYPFRPWNSVDDRRTTPFPYSSTVIDKAHNLAYVLSYSHQDISRIDLSTGAVTHFVDPRIAFESDMVVDSQGNVLFYQSEGLMKLSTKGDFSIRSWPAGFYPGDASGGGSHQNAIVLDDKERCWIVGNYRLVCMPETGGGTVYSFEYSPGGSDGWFEPTGLLWRQGRLWLSNNGSSIDTVGNLLEFQVPPSDTLATPTDPLVTVQPSSIQIGQYQPGHLAIEATANGTLTYQWRLNGTAIPGAFASYYDVPAATGTDAGNYACEITNSLYGQNKRLISGSATLSLVQDPSIPQFTASTSRVRAGQSVSLTPWFSGGIGLVNPGGISVTSGTAILVRPDVTTTYTLTVTNSLGVSVAADLAIDVEASGQLITSFTAAPPVVDFGQTTSLAWFASSPPTSLSLRDDLGLLGPVDLMGSTVSIQSPSRRQTLLLSATAPGLNETAAVRVAARGVDVFAGHSGGQGELDGQGADARMNSPGPMTAAPDGTLLFADWFDPVIRQATPDGLVTTLCGNSAAPGDQDGSLSQARFSKIAGLALAVDGTLYILDEVPVPNTPYGNAKLKRLTPAGQVVTMGIVGGCGSGGRGDMAFDAQGNLFIPLQEEDKVISVDPSGAITTAVTKVASPSAVAVRPDGTLIILGNGGGILSVAAPDGSIVELSPSIALGDPLEGKSLGAMMGLSGDASGNLYVASPMGVFSLDAAYQAHTLAESDATPFEDAYYANVRVTAQGFLWATRIGMGAELVKVVPGSPAVSAAGLIRPYADQADPVPPDIFMQPRGLARGTGDSVIVSDPWFGRARLVSPSGACQDISLGTLIGDLNWAALWCDASGRIVFSSGLRDLQRYDSRTGLRTTLVIPSWVWGISDGSLGHASIGAPRGIVGDKEGNIYFLDTLSEGDWRIAQLYLRKIKPDGTVVTLAGGGSGFADGTGSAAKFKTLRGLAMDPQGNLVIVDQGNHAIRRATPQGDVTTVAGGSGQGYVDGLASQALFNSPSGVAVDAQGNIFVADTDNAAIRVITPDGQVRTLVGNPAQPGTRIGPVTHAGLYRPMDVMVNKDGDLYVTDSGVVLQFTAPMGH